jgi:hypothetical protein
LRRFGSRLKFRDAGRKSIALGADGDQFRRFLVAGRGTLGQLIAKCAILAFELLQIREREIALLFEFGILGRGTRGLAHGSDFGPRDVEGRLQFGERGLSGLGFVVGGGEVRRQRCDSGRVFGSRRAGHLQLCA